MSSSSKSNTAGTPGPAIVPPKAAPGYSLPVITKRDKSTSEMAREAARALSNLPVLSYGRATEGKDCGKLVEIILIKAGLYVWDPILKRKIVINAYHGTFPNISAFVDFAHRLLTAMSRWLGGMLQNEDSMAGLLDMAFLDQDSPGIEAARARPFYHTGDYLGWKFTATKQGLTRYQVHSEPDPERRAFFQDVNRCRWSFFLHHEGTKHWTGVFADHRQARMWYFDSRPVDIEAGAARARLLLAEFFTVNGHRYAKHVRSWDIILETGFRQDDEVSSGPAVAEFFRTIYRELEMGVQKSSHMAPADPTRRRHQCLGGNMTDCIKSGWRDSVGAVLNIGLGANTNPLLCPAAGGGNIQEILTRTCEEMGLAEASLGKHLTGNYHRPSFRSYNITLEIDNKALTIRNLSTQEIFKSQRSPAPSTAATLRTHPSTRPGTTGSSPIEIASTASGRSASAAKGTTSEDVDMMTVSMGSMDISAEDFELHRSLAKANREKEEARRRRDALPRGSGPWSIEDEKVASWGMKIKRLLDELSKRNEKY